MSSNKRKYSKTSTERRLDLAAYIDTHGVIMPSTCTNCRENRRVCRVHVKSGRCSECNRHNSRCDIRVTAAEFASLKTARLRLLQQLEEAREATSRAIAREQRLMKELQLVEKRASDAISIESRSIEEQEAEEELLAPGPAPSGELALSPFTWSAMDGMDDGFWDSAGLPDPVVVGPGDRLEPVSGN